MRFALPMLGWLALLAVPVVVLYFLKLRRPRVVIPSLVLWRQALNDQRVNSPFQRFRRNLLLWLQLLLLAAVVLAAMQPFWTGGREARDRLPILVDLSASMGARDREGGPTRLDEAKRRARERIAALRRGQQAAILGFGRSAREVIGFTDNARLLLDALDRLRVEDTPGDPEDALRMAAALHKRDAFGQAWLLSDGNLPARLNVELPFRLEFERVGEPAPGVGITAFNARRSPRGSWEVFVELRAAGPDARGGSLEIRRDGAVLSREAVSVTPGEATPVTLELPADQPARLEAVLTALEFDGLASDNRARLDLPAIEPLRVWIDPALPQHARAFAGRPGESVPLGGPLPDAADLRILRAPAPASTSAAATLLSGAAPPELEAVLEKRAEGGTVTDWKRNHPLLRHVTLRDLVMTDGFAYRAGKGEADVEQAGFEVLAHGSQGPLLVADTRGHAASFALLFSAENSTLPFRVGFPVLLQNLARLAHERRGTEEVSALRTGVLPDRATAPGASVTLRGPDGSSRTAAADAAGAVRGLPAPFAGEYELSAGASRETLAASLLDAGETELRTVDSLAVGELSVAAEAASRPSDRPLWTAFALAGLVLLLLEWHWFNRRPGGNRVAGA